MAAPHTTFATIQRIEDMMISPVTRRHFLYATAGAAALTVSTSPARARWVSGDDTFPYEVTRTEAEWRATLTDDEYMILREGHTEAKKSHPYWEKTSEEAGIYSCKGCDLEIYEAKWKTVLEIGWVFFQHSIPNTVMTGIEWPEGSEMMDEFKSLTAMEAHCRRCGSHLGHLVPLKGQVLHCINGASLKFRPAAV
ncbi:peptide-methionine (R)-S-oxide reductase [Actibacterium sp. 188UL27-1]|uniref:peptide-methionine (R)-S-oxide reductase n=1 Tax=Actibacterium sp. 188UL27-1 TaxID=2786961 RepID=UPI001958E7CC|nr:peptide-methionine (R)-S-oxide reductase [Actibacterium sp. 188UL27-1]MBM7070109.1 peptide-methionine (R)-S-oxide reductase [Actibacterium sp. 188UL27-1]